MYQSKERGQMDDAVRILGLKPRNISHHASRGEYPGAAKRGGVWTFDLQELRNYLERKKWEQCQKAAQKHYPAPSGVVTSSMVGLASTDASSAGRYRQATQRLRRSVARQAKIAS